MDILFFSPPNTRRGNRIENRALLWLASYLLKNGVNSKVFYLGKDFRITVRKALKKYEPKYVAISCKWYTNLYGAFLVAKEVKNFDKEIITITGGNTASYFDRDVLSNSNMDIVIRGDAEDPLLYLLTKGEKKNCTVREIGKIIRYEQDYVQRQGDLENYTLVDPKKILENPKEVLKGLNFIWTGKGCIFNCFYCGGSAKSQKKIFGRAKPIWRPIEDVLIDIEYLTKYSKWLQFDFTNPVQKDDYYIQLFQKISQKKFKCDFHHWSLPTKELIEQISKTFNLVNLGIDTSTLCEDLRRELTKRGWLKPFFTNQELENIIDYCSGKGNVQIELNNVAGMPGEKGPQVKEHTQFAKHLARKYPSIIGITYTPLSIEPGAMLQRDYRRFKMHCSRKGFLDFYNLAKGAFENNICYPFDGFLLRGGHMKKYPHPYGVYQIGYSKRCTYLRTRYFHKILDKELPKDGYFWSVKGKKELSNVILTITF